MSAPDAGEPAQQQPDGVPVEPTLELHPLEVHIERLRAELQRTQLVVTLAAAAAVLAALACLYAARNGGGVVRP